MENKPKKILSLLVMSVAVLSMLLFAFQIVSAIVFWIILALAGFYAYFILPKLKK